MIEFSNRHCARLANLEGHFKYYSGWDFPRAFTWAKPVNQYLNDIIFRMICMEGRESK